MKELNSNSIAICQECHEVYPNDDGLLETLTECWECGSNDLEVYINVPKEY
jgi:hypothetical protein